MKKLLLTCALQIFVYTYGQNTDSYVYDYRQAPAPTRTYYYQTPYYVIQPQREQFWYSPWSQQPAWQPYQPYQWRESR